jgi:hypothetical protein
MADLVVVIGVLAFFALAALFVAGCDRILGPDDEHGRLDPQEGATPAGPGIPATVEVER